MNAKFEKGDLMINVTATTIIVKVIENVGKRINEALDLLLSSKEFKVDHLQTFMIATSKCD